MFTRVQKYRVLLLLAFVGSHFHAYPQQQTLDLLVKTFDSFRKYNFQEKIYVHTDREFYVTGETLWFKAYNVDAILNKPSDVSKVLYVEMIDDKNTPALQTKVAIASGSGSGSFYIPASMGSGNYTFRAYTQWMNNSSPELFFSKSISIVNPFLKPELSKSIPAANVFVDFFPEGGNLVAGLKSTVAFKVRDERGRGIDCSGSIMTSAGDTAAIFKSEKFGIGKFSFTPQAGTQYTARLIDPKNTVSLHALPVVNAKGYVMTVRDTSDQYLRVEVAYAPRKSEVSYIYLLAHTRQIVAYAQMLPILGNTVVFQIEKTKLGPGISHITLFDGDLKPVCERLYFQDPEQLGLRIETDQTQYGIRRRVKASVNSSLKEPSDLSVSVFKIDSLSPFQSEDILNYFWLSSDLTGEVESPHYYFSNDAGRQKAMDNLMLTHGWRRFKWQDALEKKPVIDFIPEYRGHVIHARVTNQNGKPVAGLMTYLASPDRVIKLYPSVSNRKGSIKFEVPEFYGSRELILQTSSDSAFNIEVQNPFSNAPVPSHPLILDKNVQQELIDRSISMQVQDIFNEYSRGGVTKTQIDSVPFYGKADEIYYLDDYTRFPVMEEVMREYVPGVLVRKRKDGYHFLVLDAVNKTVMHEDPLILLDGVPIKTADEIMKLDPRKVRKLEVVTRPYFLGPATFKGIVSYTTYRGDLAGFQLDPKAIRIDYEGLQLEREFYSPRYENENQRKDRVPDQRSVLYWHPAIWTASDGKAEFEFFTSDEEGSFMIRVEGLTPNGIAGSGTYLFHVKRFNN